MNEKIQVWDVRITATFLGVPHHFLLTLPALSEQEAREEAVSEANAAVARARKKLPQKYGRKAPFTVTVDGTQRRPGLEVASRDLVRETLERACFDSRKKGTK